MSDRKVPWTTYGALWLALAGSAAAAAAAPATPAAPARPAKATPSVSEILSAAPASAWRPLADEHTLYMQLPAGRVVIELEPAMAPHTVGAIEKLVRMHYFEGAVVVRVQDNYVAQWSVPGTPPDESKPVPADMRTLPAEFSVPASAAPFTVLPDRDGFAPEAGFVDSFPAARDPAAGRMWLTHCYGAVGVGRDVDPASGNGSELYAVIGHAPRHLDGNVTVVGRVRQGIEFLSSLPRGSGGMGMYDTAAQKVPISGVRMAADVPAAERSRLEVLRTDTPTYAAVLDARRNLHDGWYVHAAGYIDICNAPLPVRPMR